MTIIEELQAQEEQEFIEKTNKRKLQLQQAHNKYVSRHKDKVAGYMREYMRGYRKAPKTKII